MIFFEKHLFLYEIVVSFLFQNRLKGLNGNETEIADPLPFIEEEGLLFLYLSGVLFDNECLGRTSGNYLRGIEALYGGNPLRVIAGSIDIQLVGDDVRAFGQEIEIEAGFGVPCLLIVAYSFAAIISR